MRKITGGFDVYTEGYYLKCTKFGVYKIWRLGKYQIFGEDLIWRFKILTKFGVY